MLLVAGFASLSAQESMIISIKGFVTDEFGNPLYNALLVSANKANQYITNPDGSYDFQIRDASTYLTVSYPGFHNQDLSSIVLILKQFPILFQIIPI